MNCDVKYTSAGDDVETEKPAQYVRGATQGESMSMF